MVLNYNNPLNFYKYLALSEKNKTCFAKFIIDSAILNVARSSDTIIIVSPVNKYAYPLLLLGMQAKTYASGEAGLLFMMNLV